MAHSFAQVSIHQQEVHVWSAPLTVSMQEVCAFEQSLAPDERDRANRFRFEQDKTRFIVSRGILRDILSRYLQLEPAEVQFAYGVYGKPMLAPSLKPTGLEFNLSHSGEMALYAIAHQKQVGVDLEQLRVINNLEQLARQCLSPRELQAFLRLEPAQRQTSFFYYWTGKEAYLKALGQGLRIPLEQIEIPLDTSKPTQVLSEKAACQSHDWYLQTVPSSKGYIAALVVEGQAWQPIYQDWSAYP
jgi:4'-phosphopantetheinyl transferase